MRLTEIVLELSNRLAELEWKIEQPSVLIRSTMLPRGLFRHAKVSRNIDYVQEIRDDLTALSHPAGLERAEYLALKIQEKINVLVRICQISKAPPSPAESSSLNMQSMMTRQQWLADLKAEIERLEGQQNAMLQALEALDKRNINAEHEARIALAHIEKRLTLARETFERAIK